MIGKAVFDRIADVGRVDLLGLGLACLFPPISAVVLLKKTIYAVVYSAVIIVFRYLYLLFSTQFSKIVPTAFAHAYNSTT